MKKICSGARCDEGVTWFTELSDKAKATKTHFYWAMRNNDGTEEGFQQYLLNIVDHYQGKHALCHQDSRCKQENYVCSKKTITNPRAVLMYPTAVTKTTIYKNPKDYLMTNNHPNTDSREKVGNDDIDIFTNENMENTPLRSQMQFRMNFTSPVRHTCLYNKDDFSEINYIFHRVIDILRLCS